MIRDRVVAAAAVDRIGAAVAVDRVGAAGAVKAVGARGARYLQRNRIVGIVDILKI